ncbi:MAG: poly(A) polymerase, partial [Cyanobacteria bacterium P01_F01_bin.143]
KLEQIELEITAKLADCNLASEIYQLLKPYKHGELILLAARTSPENRNIIWNYLTKLSKVQAILNGNDLKELGYKPGHQYKEMLDQLLAATLDKTITSRDEAEAFLKVKY